MGTNLVKGGVLLKRRVNLTREVYIGAILVLMSGFFIIETNKLNAMAARYPRIILFTLLVLSAALLAQGVYYSLNIKKISQKYGKEKQEINLSVLDSVYTRIVI